MNGRFAKHYRKEFRKHWRTDVDQLFKDLEGFSLGWRLRFAFRIIFGRAKR